MAGEADGDDADALHGGPEGGEVANGAPQPGAIIEIGHSDQLGVHVDTALSQPAKLRHDVWGGGVAQELPPFFQVGDVDGDVQRGEAHLFDALPVVVVEVCEGDEVAEEEGIAVVVVLDVQGAAKTGGHLQHEAEFAQVVATANVGVEGGMNEGQAEFLPIVAFRFQEVVRFSTTNEEFQGFVSAVVLDVDDILHGVVVDRQEFVARLQANAGSDGAGGDGGNYPACAGGPINFRVQCHVSNPSLCAEALSGSLFS